MLRAAHCSAWRCRGLATIASNAAHRNTDTDTDPHPHARPHTHTDSARSADAVAVTLQRLPTLLPSKPARTMRPLLDRRRVATGLSLPFAPRLLACPPQRELLGWRPHKPKWPRHSAFFGCRPPAQARSPIARRCWAETRCASPDSAEHLSPVCCILTAPRRTRLWAIRQRFRQCTPDTVRHCRSYARVCVMFVGALRSPPAILLELPQSGL